MKNKMGQLSAGVKTHLRTPTGEIAISKLQDLIKLKQNKISPVFSSCHVQAMSNQKEINVVSPFYDRSKCVSKGPCYCPYHRKKRLMQVGTPFKKRNKEESLGGFADGGSVKKTYRKIKTDQNETKITRSKQFVKQNCLKSIKIIPSPEKQNYNNVAHKVECRNSEFEYFLKKNQLYILTGKFSNNKIPSDLFQVDSFLQSIYKNIQSNEDLEKPLGEDDENLSSTQSRKVNRRHGKAKTINFHKQFGEDGFISKVRKLIQSILSGRKKMSVRQLEKLRSVFSNLLEQEKQFEGETSTYLKNKECLKKFDEFIHYFTGSFDKNGGLQKIHSKSSLKSQIYHQNGKMASPAGEDDIITIGKTVKQSKAVRVSLAKQRDIINEVDENTPRLDEHTNHHIFRNSKQMSKQRFTQKNDRVHYHQVNEADLLSKNAKKQTVSTTRNRKNYLHKANNQNMFKQNFFRQNQHGRQSKDLINELRNDANFYYPLIPYAHKKNEKQAKLQQIFNQIKEDTTIDKNYLKMKKYIQRNKRFLRKMEIKLNHLDLGVFVIEPTDSLITRKKKIRCLKEMVSKQNFEKKGVYDEIMKYLDIYTQHCNMLLKREIKKNQEQVYFQYLDEELIEILTSKDFTNSLKFITLHQNQEYEKEDRLEWWISIPQYVTNDSTRQKKYNQFEESYKFIETTQKQKPAEISVVSDDSLIQKDMETKCTIKCVRESERNEQTQMIQKTEEKKQDQKTKQSKFQKLWRRYRDHPDQSQV